MANIDPRLTKAIRAAKASGSAALGNVQAVVTLRSTEKDKPLDPDQAERSVREIVDKVARRVRRAPKDLVIFPNIQSFSIDADADMLRDILNDKDIDTATLNE